MPYYPHLGGNRVADVGVFYSLESKFSFSGNGRNVRQADASDSHTPAVMQAASRLIAAHVPFSVLTKNSLNKLDRLKVLILSNVNAMDGEECEAIRSWVRGGGCLYASGPSSLVDKRGKLHEDFMLGDVFGVSLLEKPNWDGYIHYVAPTREGAQYFTEFSEKYPAYTRDLGMKVKARPGRVFWRPRRCRGRLRRRTSSHPSTVTHRGKKRTVPSWSRTRSVVAAACIRAH